MGVGGGGWVSGKVLEDPCSAQVSSWCLGECAMYHLR